MREAIDRAFVWLERRLDRAFGARANPLRHLGALGFLFFWVLAASGIYLYIRFDTSVAGAYGSIGRLSREEWWFGGLLRSVHRYAADGFVLVTLLHLLREFAAGRFSRFRTFSWISGVPLLWLLYASGTIGYWLVWDARAQFSALATAEWFDALGFGAEPMVRNFAGTGNVVDRLFSLFVFLHIGLPLALLAGMWVHVQRIGMPKDLPARSLAAGTIATLLVAAILRPALSEVPWDPTRLPAVLEMDWFVLTAHPLMYATSPTVLWIIALGFTAALVALPWLRRARAPLAAQVDPHNCNGCGRCVADCPYQAVILSPRSDGVGTKIAEVMAERCAACGICAGACPSSTPFRAGSGLPTGIDLPDASVQATRERLEAELARITGAERIVVFGCDSGARVGALADPSTAAISLRCIALLPPSFIEYALRSGAEGVLVAGCREGECLYRLGMELTEERLAGKREPHLRASVPRERIRLGGFGAGDEPQARVALETLRRELYRLGPARRALPKRRGRGA
jgi:quinol-cytochrome oxidoreductase complex cytochrome b subunit/coenzyme F420-reducing hydrogenase delta subunit